MKLQKWALALVLGTVLLSGCSSIGHKKETVTLTDPVLSVTQGIAIDLTGFETQTAVKAHLQMNDEDSDMNVSITDRALISEKAMTMHINVTGVNALTGVEEKNTDMYVEKNRFYFTTYTDMDGTWVKQQVKNASYEDAIGPYDTRYTINMYLKNADWVQTGLETIDGASVLHYTGTIPSDKVWSVANTTGSLAYLGLSGIQAEMFSDVEPVTVELWVAADGYAPVQLSVDYTAAFVKMMENIKKAFPDGEQNVTSIQIIEYSEKNKYTRLNAGEEVTIPDEVLAAVDYKDYNAQKGQ